MPHSQDWSKEVSQQGFLCAEADISHSILPLCRRL